MSNDVLGRAESGEAQGSDSECRLGTAFPSVGSSAQDFIMAGNKCLISSSNPNIDILSQAVTTDTEVHKTILLPLNYLFLIKQAIICPLQQNIVCLLKNKQWGGTEGPHLPSPLIG